MRYFGLAYAEIPRERRDDVGASLTFVQKIHSPRSLTHGTYGRVVVAAVVVWLEGMKS
jgi:hypothetical protein